MRDGGTDAAAGVESAGVDLTVDSGLGEKPSAAANHEGCQQPQLHQVTSIATTFPSRRGYDPTPSDAQPQLRAGDCKNPGPATAGPGFFETQAITPRR